MEVPILGRNYPSGTGVDSRPREFAHCIKTRVGVSQETLNPAILHRMGEFLSHNLNNLFAFRVFYTRLKLGRLGPNHDTRRGRRNRASLTTLYLLAFVHYSHFPSMLRF